MKAAQVLGGLAWSAGATGLNALAQIVFLAVLARLLEPAAFGLMAMAAIALRFASFFAQLGFTTALVQKATLNDEDISAVWLMAGVLGLLLGGLIATASPLFGAYFRSNELVPVLCALAATLVLGNLAGLPQAMLRRDGRFRDAAGVETAGYLLGYGVVGIFGALAGWGVWSLVAATLAQQAVALALGIAAVRPRFAWPVPRAAFGHFWRFGSRHSLIGFLEFLWANVESLAIGRLFGQSQLGLFNRAITLTNLPVEQGVNAVGKVMFPAFSRLAPERARLADAFCMLLLGVGVVAAALACGIAAASADIVALALGPRWIEASPLVAIVAFAVPPMFMFVVCGIVLDSLAALRAKLRLQAGLLVMKVVLVALAVPHGLVAIAGAVVLAELLRLGLGIRLVARILAVPRTACWPPALAAAMTGAAVYAAVAFVATNTQDAGWPLAGRFAAEAFGGGVALLLALAALAIGGRHYAPVGAFDPIRRSHARVLSWLRLEPSR